MSSHRMNGPLELQRFPSTPRDLDSEGVHRHATNTWKQLSLPDRRDLTIALKRCNVRESSEVDLLSNAIRSKEVRDIALSVLCKRDYLIQRPSSRGKLLEALTPYANELPVQAYAMMSLRDPLYHRSFSVCAPAARIIEADKAQRDPTITYELLELAARLTPAGKDGAAKLAFILLKDSVLSPAQFRTALFNTRVWYAEFPGNANPWLPIIAQRKDIATVRLLKTILEGDMSDPRDHPVLASFLTLPLLPHEVAVTASILTIAARKVGQLFGQNNNLAATTAAMAATAIIVGIRYMVRASTLDKFNCSRDHERIEAAKVLGLLLHETRAENPKLDRKLNARIHKILSENSGSFLQAPQIRAAAAVALSGSGDVVVAATGMAQHRSDV